ncbi:uncharacterized protein LOC105833481 isoform X2 [Monomorium pharaonis]|uniref:uncharacterized protein LOC105833481 isoform X2 n=1 Tax=Monomorium pharaonis TaxID=307658 RepID=UPI00063F3AA6|nr:uncharacterized protein LOC105833481 isoform X2 [Monomorium pharaonis]
MNQLNHYVSTYQKDYTWPYISSTCCTPPPTKPIVIKACICTDLQPAYKKLERDGTLDWSQMGPTGQLVLPKIYPKIKQAPVTDVPPFDQPSHICLREGRPDLIEMLERSLPRETIARVNGDRMKTTYQMDYSDPASRTTQRDLAVAVVDANGRHVPCGVPIKITVETDCPSCCRLPVSTRNGDTGAWERVRKRMAASKRNEIKCRAVGRPQMTPIHPWKSEYQDNISRIGHVIAKAKLHHARKKAVPFQYQYSVTAN